MNLYTIYTLNYGDDGGIIEEDEKIKVFLKNGEILIGDYLSSDNTSLEICRSDGFEVLIDFEEIEDIEKVN